jgi:hypothetical protein
MKVHCRKDTIADLRVDIKKENQTTAILILSQANYLFSGSIS